MHSLCAKSARNRMRRRKHNMRDVGLSERIGHILWRILDVHHRVDGLD
jgi:hypothetical protein